MIKFLKRLTSQPRTSYGKYDFRITWKTRLARFVYRFVIRPTFIAVSLIVIGFAVYGASRAYEVESAEAQSITVVSARKDVPPILTKIATCESGNRQFDKKGNVIFGKKTPNDVGRYQISMTHWGIRAMEMDLNLLEEADNEAMAVYIFENYGTDPWNSSKGCWGR